MKSIIFKSLFASILMTSIAQANTGSVTSSLSFSQTDQAASLKIINTHSEDLFCQRVSVEANYFEIGSRRPVDTLRIDIPNIYLRMGETLEESFGEEDFSSPYSQDDMIDMGSAKLEFHNDCWQEPNLEQYCEYADHTTDEQVTLSSMFNAAKARDCKDLAKNRPSSLRLNGLKLESIKPIGFLRSLKRLDLGDNAISSTKELKGLVHLQSLDLDNNQIHSLEGIENLKALKRLSLKNNDLSDLKALASATQLTKIDLSSARVEDLSPLFLLEKTCIEIASLQVPNTDANIQAIQLIKQRNRRYCR
ncbi:MAG: leucine-rich repeat domain-containing protein [Bdellovibrionales bacterium]